MKFDNSGKILQETDRFGKWIRYDYSGEKIISIADSQSRVVALTYDASGRITRADGPSGWAVIYGYGAAGNLISAQDVRTGLAKTYSYDTNHRLKQTTNPYGDVDFTNGFDNWGIASTEKDNRQNRFTRVYDRTTKKETVRNESAGKDMIREYDSNQRLVKETDYLGNSTSYSYLGAYRKPATVTDAKGHAISLEYDSAGHVTKIIDPLALNALGYTARFIYDLKGHVTWMRDAKDIETTFTYDAAGNRGIWRRPPIMNIWLRCGTRLIIRRLHLYLLSRPRKFHGTL